MRRLRPLLLLAASAAVALVACGPSGEKKGVPIDGTLTTALGPSAPLTLAVGEVFGTGFQVDALLDGVAVTGSSDWACYAPLPPDYPNFDIEAYPADQSWAVLFSVSPALWGTGTIQLGEDAAILIAGEDRYGIASTGTVTLTAAGEAPDTAGNFCGFSVNGPLDLHGERDK